MDFVRDPGIFLDQFDQLGWGWKLQEKSIWATVAAVARPINTSGQIITTSAEVTLNGGLIRELPQNPLNSGLGIILICPDT